VDADPEVSAVAMPTESMVEVRGTRLRLVRGGSGAPLLFLHGASGHVGWLPVFERLSQRFDVLLPEHPGFGRSDDPPWLDRPGDLAYFYLDLMAALNLHRVHLVGTSLGGWIAAELAVRNTARLASLTLTCAVGIPAQGKPIDDIFRMSAEENARRFYHDPARVQRRLDAAATADARIVMRNRSTVVRLAYPNFVNPDLPKWLHRIDVPTLLVWGENDGLVPPRFGEAYEKLIPGSKLVVIPRAGHAPFEEQEDAFLAAFDGFVGVA
jgi:pimeloyl-ACP methyl ester carboxylesterase